MTTTATFESWPELRVSDWEQTRDTVHMWSQIVGKTRMALAPNENHWWQVALYVNSVGLTTSLMPYDGYGLEIVFDFVDHVLDITTTKGERRQVRLEPRTTADFYADYLAQLESLGISVPIYDHPVEVAESIPFPQDTTHASYDADAVKLFWHQLVSAQRVSRSSVGSGAVSAARSTSSGAHSISRSPDSPAVPLRCSPASCPTVRSE